MRRLDQFLANLGYCSRREARTWVEDGRVTVGTAVAGDPGQKAEVSAVRIDGESLDHPEEMFLLLHKPAGTVCSHETREGPRVYDLLPPRWQRRNPAVTSIGRLDQDTTGLLLLTDRSELVHRLTSPKHKVPKVYRATLNRDAPSAEAEAMTALFAGGALRLKDEDAPCRPAQLRWRGPREAELTLLEGRYHQVKRMFASQGFTVTALHREGFGNLELGDLPAGQWRELPLDYFPK